MIPTETPGDVIDVLVSDHREVTALIGNIWSVKDPMIRRDLTDTAISELVRHAVAEEMYVYPVMRKYLSDGEQAVAHDIEEHDELERTMKRLEAVDVSSVDSTTRARGLPSARRHLVHPPGHKQGRGIDERVAAVLGVELFPPT
jgi:hemerythrin superfamily protein